jgi:hypothetical protein
MEADDGDDLRAEIRKLLAAALAADEGHVAEMNRRDELHIAETDRRDVLHTDEMQRRQDGFEHELLTIREALETRDLIGQGKGIIMGSMGCSADEAYLLLKKQSQAENLKLTDIVAEIVSRTQRRRDS